MRMAYVADDFLQWKESECQVKKIAFSSLVTVNVLRFCENLYASVSFFIYAFAVVAKALHLGAALRTFVGGMALMGGIVLASGVNSIPSALLTLATFAVASLCLKEEKGGAA